MAILGTYPCFQGEDDVIKQCLWSWYGGDGGGCGGCARVIHSFRCGPGNVGGYRDLLEIT